MYIHYRIIACMVMVLALVAGCELTKPATTPAPPTYTPVPSTATPVLPTPTATPAPTTTSEPTPHPVVPLDGRGGGMIVFSSDRDGNYEIYAMNADGSGQRRLTKEPATDGMPNWSPDGKRIAFDRIPFGLQAVEPAAVDNRLHQLVRLAIGCLEIGW